MKVKLNDIVTSEVSYHPDFVKFSIYEERDPLSFHQSDRLISIMAKLTLGSACTIRECDRVGISSAKENLVRKVDEFIYSKARYRLQRELYELHNLISLTGAPPQFQEIYTRIADILDEELKLEVEPSDRKG